jgi:chemotaxis protein MotA
VGHGIAVSFVATVYGVGIANIFFLPVAAKIKARAHQTMQIRELILEGVIGIVEGLNPKLIRMKLEAYSGNKQHAAAAAGKHASKEKPTDKDRQAASEAA